MKHLFLIMSFLFLSHHSYSGMNHQVQVVGTIKSIDKEKVTLRLQDGSTQNVPRTSIPETTILREGVSVIAYISIKEGK